MYLVEFFLLLNVSLKFNVLGVSPRAHVLVAGFAIAVVYHYWFDVPPTFGGVGVREVPMIPAFVRNYVCFPFGTSSCGHYNRLEFHIVHYLVPAIHRSAFLNSRGCYPL